MTTGWRIEPGYQSDGKYDEAWQTIKAAANGVAFDWQTLMAKAVEFGASDSDTDYPLIDYAKQYTAPYGNPLAVYEEHETLGSCVAVSASGGGQSRHIKEIVARAFCTLVVDEVHRAGYCVSLICS